jgi:hypothetical protein
MKLSRNFIFSASVVFASMAALTGAQIASAQC